MRDWGKLQRTWGHGDIQSKDREIGVGDWGKQSVTGETTGDHEDKGILFKGRRERSGRQWVTKETMGIRGICREESGRLGENISYMFLIQRKPSIQTPLK